MFAHRTLAKRVCRVVGRWAKLAFAKASASGVGEGRIEHPRLVSTAFTERPASTYGLLSGIFARLHAWVSSVAFVERLVSEAPLR